MTVRPKSPKTAKPSAVNCLSVTALLSLAGAAAVWLVYAQGWLLYYGDAEARLNHARRVLDSQTPGFDQLGTPWLPLPHLLGMPLAGVDSLWRSGLAGAIPPAVCFVIAGVFLFAAARRIFGSPVPALAASALFALNPNILYLQSIPMAESVFSAALLALLYFTVRFRDTGGWGALAGAGLASCAAALTRYEGWFLIPFVAAYIARRKLPAALTFCLLAGAAPLFWLGYNWWLTGDALYFYRGPYSAGAIQGSAPYPGKHDWRVAFYYYQMAARLCAGPVLALAGLAGAAAALWKRAFWPLFFLLLPGAFFIWSMHSSGSPIFVPVLWPNSYYNIRYGAASMPLLALAAAALVAVVPPRGRKWAAAVVVAACVAPWLLHPSPANWVTWEEARVNSEARREWTRQAAEFLAPRYVPGSGIITSFGDLTGIYREAGIPLRETFTEMNGLPWLATVRRPDLFLWQEWAVAMGGDEVQSGIQRAGLHGIRYKLEKTIIVKGAPVIEIYRRTGGMHGPS
jgi:Dolichyl-phosphate-mannose-protein mannosyltransferase